MGKSMNKPLCTLSHTHTNTCCILHTAEYIYTRSIQKVFHSPHAGCVCARFVILVGIRRNKFAIDRREQISIAEWGVLLSIIISVSWCYWSLVRQSVRARASRNAENCFNHKERIIKTIVMIRNERKICERKTPWR